MNKYIKAGLLIVTLVIPALIFTFLRFFATNHYGVPFYHPLTDSTGKVRLDKNNDTLFYAVTNFNVYRPDVKKYPEDILKGKLTVLGYLSTDCDESCKIMLSNLERIQQLRSGIPNVNTLVLTDSTVSYKTWVSADMPVVLSSSSGLKNILDKDLRFQTKIPGSKTNFSANKLVLIDEQEHIRGYYDGADPDEADRLMAEIKILDFEKKEASKK